MSRCKHYKFNLSVGSTVKPIGTHLVNLAKQQMESMLEVLKEYEAEEECAAQVKIRHNF